MFIITILYPCSDAPLAGSNCGAVHLYCGEMLSTLQNKNMHKGVCIFTECDEANESSQSQLYL